MEQAEEGPRGARCGCGRRAVTFVRYSGAHLCRDCLKESVETRVRRELRRQADLGGERRIAVAVSGGKDSLAALHLLHKVAAARRGLTLCAITVDEGIEGYRPAAVGLAADACARLFVEHRIVRIADQAPVTVDEIAASNPEKAPCSYCGVLRRKALNAEARAWGADYLATGHNLDDVAQSIFMSFARGDLGKLARLAPHDEVQEGLVPRILPLRMVPEKEIFLYALLEGLPTHDTQCPHMGRAMRGQFKEILASLEDATPGTRHAIVRLHDRLRPALRELAILDGTPAIDVCPRCGEPSMAGLCQACALLEEVAPHPQGG